MIYVEIDVAKDKHDCFITNSNGEVLSNHLRFFYYILHNILYTNIYFSLII